MINPNRIHVSTAGTNKKDHDCKKNHDHQDGFEKEQKEKTEPKRDFHSVDKGSEKRTRTDKETDCRAAEETAQQ